MKGEGANMMRERTGGFEKAPQNPLSQGGCTFSMSKTLLAVLRALLGDKSDPNSTSNISPELFLLSHSFISYDVKSFSNLKSPRELVPRFCQHPS
ncbi:hypothetical protein OIU79_000861 [Salix purpurea]|uniref:Uncharacterized protein n=1 Tax=Salix purpurea TaxID=77065 RepID=A0A9Q0V329_SALPP|nr:hypothetical protein OIU79_000861 [Salix purpurea]